MAKSIFLFNGGNYKRGVENGRKRIPQNYVEAEEMFLDLEMLSETGTGHGTDLYMGKWADQFCNLEVGDEVFIGTFPDQALYRGIWAKAYDQVIGFKVKFELVSIKDVYDAYLAAGKDINAAIGVAAYEGTPTLEYDFTDGQRNSTKDALQLAELYGGSYTDYRSNNAHKTEIIDPPIPLDESDSFYLRMTIVELGEFAGSSSDEVCCNTCNGTKYPSFKAGVYLDTSCADKQRVQRYCNCSEPLCGGACDESTSDESASIPDTTAPVVTAPETQEGTVEEPITDLQLEADSDVSMWSVDVLPDGLSLDPLTGVISGTPTTAGTTTVTVTAVDASGNVSEPVTFDWNIV